MSTPNRFLRRRAVLSKVGISSTHLFNLEKAGRFPQHMMLTPSCAVWSEAEIDAWMQERLASGQRPASTALASCQDALRAAGSRGA